MPGNPHMWASFIDGQFFICQFAIIYYGLYLACTRVHVNACAVFKVCIHDRLAL